VAQIANTAIPETPEELEELLTDDKRREAVFANAETSAEFLKTYNRVVNKQRPDITKLINEGVTKGLREFLIDAGVNRPDMTPEMVRSLPNPSGAYAKGAVGAALDKEFANTADFMESIFHGNVKGQDRWRTIRNDYSTIDPATGGFLLSESIRSELLRVAIERAIVRSRARVIPMDQARVAFPAIDSTTNASNVYGGISAAWTNQGAAIAESQATFGKVVLDANKLAAYCEVPNELIIKSIISFAAFIDQVLPEAIAWFEDIAFLTGDGGGQPLGVLNSPALVAVTKETNQPADTIVWENIVKMFSRMLPSSLDRAVWIANNDTFPQLATMALAVGTGGSAVWLNNGVAGPPMTILGRPVIFTEKVPTVGDANDIVFTDFGYYLVGDMQEVRAESSPHFKFSSDMTTYRVTEHVDGRPWLQSAITPNQGSNTLSPFVGLGARA
jgi:HK97 family phage major capsid protein